MVIAGIIWFGLRGGSNSMSVFPDRNEVDIFGT